MSEFKLDFKPEFLGFQQQIGSTNISVLSDFAVVIINFDRDSHTKMKQIFKDNLKCLPPKPGKFVKVNNDIIKNHKLIWLSDDKILSFFKATKKFDNEKIIADILNTSNLDEAATAQADNDKANVPNNTADKVDTNQVQSDSAESLEETSNKSIFSFTEVSSGTTVISLKGDNIPNIFSYLSMINLDGKVFKVGSAVRTLIDHMSITIVRASSKNYLLLCPASYANSLIETIQSTVRWSNDFAE